MASPSDIYVKGIYNRFGYFGTWLPNTPVTLGDVGFKQGRSFLRITSLPELKIPFRTRAGASPGRFHHASHSQLQVGAGASGAGSVQGAGVEAEVVVEFEREGAFVFQAENCVQYEIEDKVALARSIADALDRNEWDSNWSVVDSVVQADSATILVANSRNARVELSAASRLPEVIEKLADLQLGLQVRAQRGDVTRFLAEKGLVPLFKLSRPCVPLLTRLSQTAKKSITFGGQVASDEGAQWPSESELWEALSPDRD